MASSSHLPKKRVLVLGLDGATFRLIKPLVEADELPNIGRLMTEGAHAPLRSTLQPVTAPAWSTFLTGVNQGKHGLFDFVRRRPETYSLQVTNGRDNRGTTLFDLASQHDKRVIAVNVPYSAPPRPTNGIIVGGPFLPDLTAEQVYPTEFYSELRQLIPNYFVTAAYNPTSSRPLAEYAEQIQESIAIREQLCTHLLTKEAWDLFMVVFMEPDEVHHAYWHTLDDENSEYRNVIPETYRAIDAAIGRLLDVAHSMLTEDEELSVLVVSDHGAGPLHYMINLNQWLYEGGFLGFREEPPVGIQGLSVKGIKQRLFTRMIDAYKRYLPPGVRSMLRRQMGLDRFEQIKGELESTLLMSKIDWAQTSAYALGAGGNIYINLAEREPEGIVASGAAYEALCNQLIAHLHLLADPETGAPLIKKVHRRSELYHGPYTEQAPDLIIEWTDCGYWGRGRYDSQAPVFEKSNQFDFSDQPLTGSHHPDGILIASGPYIRSDIQDDDKSGAESAQPQLMDIAPTILALLGIEAPPDMDGRLLDELLDLDDTKLARLSKHLDRESARPDAAGQPEVSDEDAEKIAERLRALGYL